MKDLRAKVNPQLTLFEKATIEPVCDNFLTVPFFPGLLISYSDRDRFQQQGKTLILLGLSGLSGVVCDEQNLAGLGLEP